MGEFHIAEVNIGRILAPLDSPVMEGFVSRLDEINALADTSPGFVWRLQTDGGNATYLRPYDDDRVLFNLSVWKTIEELKDYTYRTAHAELLKGRRAWFEHMGAPAFALWWVPAGHIPGVDEAKRRLERLQAEGPSDYAFTFRQTFPLNPDFLRGFDWGQFVPCPAG